MVSLINNYENILVFVLAVYEFFARLIPTIKNYSVLDVFYKLLKKLVPNKIKQ